MPEDKIIQEVIETLNSSGIEYMITGASAAIYYGQIRLTHDIDIVIELKPNQVEKLSGLAAKGYYFDADSAKKAIADKEQFNIIHGATGLKFDFWLLGLDEYSRVRFKRRRQVSVYNTKAFLISAEDLIIIKLIWYKKSQSEKHFSDALGVYQIQKGSVDGKYILQWAIKQDTVELWQKIREQAG